MSGPRNSSVAIGVRSTPVAPREHAGRRGARRGRGRACRRPARGTRAGTCRLDLAGQVQVLRGQHRPAVLAPRLLVAAGPPVSLTPEAPERRDALLGVDRGDVEADQPADEHQAQGEVGVLGDGVLVPAAEGAQPARASRAVRPAVGRELEERLAAVLVDEVAAVVVDRDAPREAGLVRVADDAATLHRADRSGRRSGGPGGAARRRGACGRRRRRRRPRRGRSRARCSARRTCRRRRWAAGGCSAAPGGGGPARRGWRRCRRRSRRR